MIEELELIDIFRKQYPQKLSFSYESKALKVYSRIDFFLVAHTLSKCVVNIHTKASNAPDHNAVKLSLEFSEERRGPGLWKFNNALVDDEEYVKRIKANYPIIGKKYPDLDDHGLKWEFIKMEIRGRTIAYSENKAKRQRKRESDVQIRIEELEKRISDSTNADFINKALNEKEILKQQFLLFYQEKANGLMATLQNQVDGKGWETYEIFL